MRILNQGVGSLLFQINKSRTRRLKSTSTPFSFFLCQSPSPNYKKNVYYYCFSRKNKNRPVALRCLSASKFQSFPHLLLCNGSTTSNSDKRTITTNRAKQSITYYYDVLGVSPKASQKDIKDAYYKMSKIHHPDVSKDPESHRIFTEINEAYETLGNPEKKSVYDQEASVDLKKVYNYKPSHGKRQYHPKYGWSHPPPPRKKNYYYDEQFRKHISERLKRAEEYDEFVRQQYAKKLEKDFEEWERNRWKTVNKSKPMTPAQRTQKAKNIFYVSLALYVMIIVQYLRG